MNEHVDELCKVAPMEPPGEPDDIANTIQFLAGSDGGWIDAKVIRTNSVVAQDPTNQTRRIVMFSIIGITGRVGGSAASRLLEMGKQVRTVVRDEAKGHVWASKGASVAVADMTDGDGLGRAIAGSDAVFVMLPPLHDCAKSRQPWNCWLYVRPFLGASSGERFQGHTVQLCC
jgi:NAD(P)H-binding